MISRKALLLGALALTLCTGCTGGLRSVAIEPASGDGAGIASPPTLQVPQCRTSGVYNRAANLCVSEGP